MWEHSKLVIKLMWASCHSILSQKRELVIIAQIYLDKLLSMHRVRLIHVEDFNQFHGSMSLQCALHIVFSDDIS